MRTLLLAAALLCSLPALAALPPQPPEDLKKNASHIVVGQVGAVYSVERARDRDGFVDRLYLIELTVTALEKGDGPAIGKVLYTKCWQPAQRPPGFAGPQGQNEIPKPARSARLYLTRADDGSYALLSPNGWVPVEP